MIRLAEARANHAAPLPLVDEIEASEMSCSVASWTPAAALEDGGRGRGGSGPAEAAAAGVDAGGVSPVEEHLAVEEAAAHSPSNIEEGADVSSQEGAKEAARALEAWRAAVWVHLQEAGPVQNLNSVPSWNSLPES